MHKNKKAVELSINFLVVLILAIAIFGFGLKFVYDIVTKANDIQEVSSQDLDKQIKGLLCNSNDKVCIGIDRRETHPGKTLVYGLSVLNPGTASKTYNVQITTPDECYVSRTDETITDETENDHICGDVQILNGVDGTRTIENIPPKESQSIGIGAIVSKEAKEGTYIFNLKIIDTETSTQHGTTQKLYVTVK